MPELFVPPSKSAAPVAITAPETLGLLESDSLDPNLISAENQALPQSLATVERFFFYGLAANGEPELYQVNVSEGTLAIASDSLELFPTALEGLLTAEPTVAPWLVSDSHLLQDDVPAPEIQALEIQTSDLQAPEIQAPEIQAPEIQTFESAALAVETLESETAAAELPAIDVLEAEALPSAALPTDSLGPTSEGAAPLEAAALAMPPATAELSVFTLLPGTDGKNFLIGTAADNAVFGFGGDDLILLGAGNNLAFGGQGQDTVIGGAGNDSLFGGVGNDVIEGGAGNDHLFGGAGDDILYGGAGANLLVGGAGADSFRLGTPGAYGIVLVGAPGPGTEPDTIVDFSLAEGDRLDFSLIAAQPAFAGVELLPWVSFVQAGGNTEVQVTTPLGQTTTEAILLNVEADTITPSSLSFTTPAGLPLLK